MNPQASTSYSSLFSNGLFASARPMTPPKISSNQNASNFLQVPPVSSMQTSSPMSISPAPYKRATYRTGGGSPVKSSQPTLRKRRSSVAMGISPMASIKSPVRAVLNAQQRTILSPTRGCENHTRGMRSFGDILGEVPEQAPRLVRRVKRTAIPALRKPAPTAPLPPIPWSQNRQQTPTLLEPFDLTPKASTINLPKPRQPLSALQTPSNQNSGMPSQSKVTTKRDEDDFFNSSPILGDVDLPNDMDAEW